jgi:hypothetical protein
MPEGAESGVPLVQSLHHERAHLGDPREIAVDVHHAGNNRIQVFSTAGVCQGQSGSPGAAMANSSRPLARS